MMLSALRKLAEQATEKPWAVSDHGVRLEIEGNEGDVTVAEIDTSYDAPFDRAESEADAVFIVAARNSFDALLDGMDALERIAESYAWAEYEDDETVVGDPDRPTNRRIAREALAALAVVGSGRDEATQ